MYHWPRHKHAMPGLELEPRENQANAIPNYPSDGVQAGERTDGEKAMLVTSPECPDSRIEPALEVCKRTRDKTTGLNHKRSATQWTLLQIPGVRNCTGTASKSYTRRRTRDAESRLASTCWFVGNGRQSIIITLAFNSRVLLPA